MVGTVYVVGKAVSIWSVQCTWSVLYVVGKVNRVVGVWSVKSIARLVCGR